MILYVKQPSETRTFTLDFTDVLDTGDTIASITSVTGTPTGLTIGSEAIDSTAHMITFEIAGGTDATTYALEAIIVTTNGETIEKDANLFVTDSPSMVSLDAQRLKVEIADFLWGERNSEGLGSAWTTDQLARMDSIIKSGLTQVYFPVSAAKEGQVHRWTFLKPVTTLETSAPYKTGTVTIVAGVVTLATGTWPAWAADGELTVEGGTYLVSSRTSDSEIVLTDTSVAVSAGATYSLNRPFYELPSDFAGMEEDMTYEPGQAQAYPPVTLVSDLEVRRRRQLEVIFDRPQMVAVRPVAFVASTGQRWRAVFYPTPNALYRLRYRYRVKLSMEVNGDLYLPGGPEIAELCLESCLAIAEQRYKDMAGIHTQNFQRLLPAAIANDLQFTTPATLGYDFDPTESPATQDRLSGLIFTFEGKTYY